MIHTPSPRVGHANFTTVEDIPPGEEVLASTFFLLEHPIIILFDSGASHDFMSLACAQKAKLTLWAMHRRGPGRKATVGMGPGQDVCQRELSRALTLARWHSAAQ
jgi:hypothetical protein